MFGVDLVTAALLISKVAFLGLGLVLYAWLSVYVRAWPACLLTVLLMTHQPILALANRPSPDSLSALCIAAVFYLFLERRALRAALVLACLSILVQPGNLLLLLLLSVVMMYGRPAARSMILGGMLAGLAGYLVVDHWSGNYSWPVLFYHVVIERLHYPAAFQGGLDLSSLLLVYRELAPLGQVFDALWWWVLVGLFVLYARYQLTTSIDDWFRCLVIGLLTMVATWLVLPFQSVADTGGLVPYYLLAVMGLATLLRTNPWFGTRPPAASLAAGSAREA